MSLLGALSNAMSGLAVAQHALDVTANNISNMNTEGYSRKLVSQEAVIVDGRGAGAQARDPARAVDDYLTLRVMAQASETGRSETLSEFHDSVQARLFGAPGEADRGLGKLLGNLAVAAGNLAANPSQSSQASAVVAAAQDLVDDIGRAGAEVQLLRGEADKAIAREIATINDELSALHEVNVEIVTSGGSAALLDRRDTLLQSLAARVELSVVEGDRGAVAVYTRGGQPLLDGEPRQLVYEPASSVAPGTRFDAIKLYRADEIDPRTGAPLAGATGDVLVSAGVRAVLTPELRADAVADADQTIVSPWREGRLQGLIEARDGMLPALADQLGEFADLVKHALNAAHNQAVAQPPPASLAGTRTDTSDYAGAARSGTAYLAVVDRATGTVATTIAIDVATLGSPGAIAAHLSSSLGALGTASIGADGRLQLTAAGGYGLALAEGDSAVTMTDGVGRTRSYGFSHYFGLNDLIVADGQQPTMLAVRKDIAADASRLARSSLDVSAGTPLTATLGGSGDGRGAQALAAAFETAHEVVARGGLAAGEYRLIDYAAQIVAAAATAADAAASEASGDRALADDLAARQSAVSGVDLDEELSRLVLFQQAYSAAARILSITSELFDELLQIGR